MYAYRANVLRSLLRIKRSIKDPSLNMKWVRWRLKNREHLPCRYMKMYHLHIYRKREKRKKSFGGKREKEGIHVHGPRASISARYSVAYISRTFMRESIRIRRLKSHGGFWPANLFSSMKCTRSILWPRAKHTEESYKHFIPVGHWTLQ